MEAAARFAMLNSQAPSILMRLRSGDSLSDEEQVQWDTFMHGVFQHYEASYQAYLAGSLPQELMDAIDQRIKAWVVLPGWQGQWRYIRPMMSQSFGSHMDELITQAG